MLLYIKYIPFDIPHCCARIKCDQTNHPGPTDMCNTSLSRTHNHRYTRLLHTYSFFSLLTAFCGTYWLTRKKMYNFVSLHARKSLISHIFGQACFTSVFLYNHIYFVHPVNMFFAACGVLQITKVTSGPQKSTFSILSFNGICVSWKVDIDFLYS